MSSTGKVYTIIHPLVTEPCPTAPLSWPLLLKPITAETCSDEETHQDTHPVQIVNITQLLDGAQGSKAQIYVVSAKLADPDTFQRLATFNMDAYSTKAEFLQALADHLEYRLKIRQNSREPVTVKEVCRRDLMDALPEVGSRGRRHATHKPRQVRFSNS